MVESARVVAVFGRQVICEVGGTLLPCHAVGSLLRRSGPLAAGDLVALERSGDEGIVRDRYERTSALRRAHRLPRKPPLVVAANVDTVVAVLSSHQPPFRAGLADRLLAAAIDADLRAVLCVNKWDLACAADDAALAPYESLGVPVLRTSARNGDGIDALRDAVVDRRTVVVGHSGVGKSSLLARLVPGLQVRVGEVNSVTGRGRHTTTTATLIRLPEGGWLVDTPGIRGFGLVQVQATELAGLFPEFQPLAGRCGFEDCVHETEPDCAVTAAVARGEITGQRYEGYLRILDSLREGRG
jgi:ribosome biogenesis GTPase / thiamine phosphate phosphatase